MGVLLLMVKSFMTEYVHYTTRIPRVLVYVVMQDLHHQRYGSPMGDYPYNKSLLKGQTSGDYEVPVRPIGLLIAPKGPLP